MPQMTTLGLASCSSCLQGSGYATHSGRTVEPCRSQWEAPVWPKAPVQPKSPILRPSTHHPGAGRLRRHSQPAGHAASCRRCTTRTPGTMARPCLRYHPVAQYLRALALGCPSAAPGGAHQLACGSATRAVLAEAPSRPPLGRHWAAIINRLLCAHHPGQRQASLPPPARARHAAPLRRRVEGAHTHTDTPPSLPLAALGLAYLHRPA